MDFMDSSAEGDLAFHCLEVQVFRVGGFVFTFEEDVEVGVGTVLGIEENPGASLGAGGSRVEEDGAGGVVIVEQAHEHAVGAVAPGVLAVVVPREGDAVTLPGEPDIPRQGEFPATELEEAEAAHAATVVDVVVVRHVEIVVARLAFIAVQRRRALPRGMSFHDGPVGGVEFPHLLEFIVHFLLVGSPMFLFLRGLAVFSYPHDGFAQPLEERDRAHPFWFRLFLLSFLSLGIVKFVHGKVAFGELQVTGYICL